MTLEQPVQPKQEQRKTSQKKREQKRNYYVQNRDKELKNKRNYYVQNRQKILEQRRNSRLQNGNKIAQRKKNYYLQDKIFNTFSGQACSCGCDFPAKHGNKFIFGHGSKRKWRPFEEAREHARSLGFKRETDWREYCKSGKKPKDIPNDPDQRYKGKGWVSWPDFLGYTSSRGVLKNGPALPYEEAKKVLRPLKISDQKEFYKLCRQGRLPKGIPGYPEGFYKRRGEWTDWYEFLGTEESRPWDKKKIIELLRSVIPIIREWHDKPSRLYTLLSANKNLNIPSGSRYNQLINNVISIAESEEGLQQIEEFLKSDSNDIPESLLPNEEEKELQTETKEELISSLSDYHGNGDTDEELLIYQQALRTPEEILNSTKNMKFDSVSVDDEKMKFLIGDNVKELWDSVYRNGIDEALLKIEANDSTFHKEYVSMFLNDYTKCMQLSQNLPIGYSFKHRPLLMQLHIAVKMASMPSYLNLSGTGAGKTLSAVIASRHVNSNTTIVISPSSGGEMIKQWHDTILAIYPDSKVATVMDARDMANIAMFENGNRNGGYKHKYIILNYDKFSQDYAYNIIIQSIMKMKVDFVILDEIQFVKTRHVEMTDTSKRHQNVAKLLTQIREQNPKVKVLGMTATPIPNELIEGKSLMELVTGVEYDDLDTKPTESNAFALHERISLVSTRYIPEYNSQLNTRHIDIDVVKPSDISIKQLRRSPMLIEQFLLEAKIPEILKNIDPNGQTIIYTEYVTEITNKIAQAVREKGYSCGLLTGDDSSGLELFKNRRIQVLVTSHVGAVGVDGLQDVCNRLIISALPWTHAQYQQLIGRIYREGQTKKNVDVIIIRGTIVKTINGKEYRFPYDPFLKWRRIVAKGALADCAIDGKKPDEKTPLSWRKALDAAIDWLERLERGEISSIERKPLNVQSTRTEMQQRIREFGDFAEMNKRYNRSKSETIHKWIQEDPTRLKEYHRQMKEAKKTWGVIPVQVIAEKIKELQAPRYMRRLVIGDFGCGEAELSMMLPDNKVHSFDHHSILAEDRITACDMKDTGLKNGTLDIAVFSISLMSTNWIDYIKEARRCLYL